jgi:hypothetical protein
MVMRERERKREREKERKKEREREREREKVREKERERDSNTYIERSSTDSRIDRSQVSATMSEIQIISKNNT